MDSHPSDFNDGAEEILMNTSFEIGAPGQNKGDDWSGCTTLESHKDSCHKYGAFGQGIPIYSCSCYIYSKIIRDKYPELSPSDLEQVCLTCRLCEAILMGVIADIRFEQ
jgi:hypothetical protein